MRVCVCVCCQLDCGTNPSLQLCSLGKVMPLACPMVCRLGEPRQVVSKTRTRYAMPGASPLRDFRPYYGYLEKSSTPAPLGRPISQTCSRDAGDGESGEGGGGLVS